jgi:hypothetical protein
MNNIFIDVNNSGVDSAQIQSITTVNTKATINNANVSMFSGITPAAKHINYAA